MLKLSPANAFISSFSWPPTSFLAASFGFIPNFTLAILRGLFIPGQLTTGDWQSTPGWPSRLAILMGLGLLVTFTFVSFLREPTLRNRTRFILHTFASVTFVTIIALTAVRVWREPDLRFAAI
jgi:hypothetical protein